MVTFLLHIPRLHIPRWYPSRVGPRRLFSDRFVTCDCRSWCRVVETGPLQRGGTACFVRPRSMPNPSTGGSAVRVTERVPTRSRFARRLLRHALPGLRRCRASPGMPMPRRVTGWLRHALLCSARLARQRGHEYRAIQHANNFL